jgi:hypothetical protein
MAPFLYFTYRDENRTLQDVGMWTGDSLGVTGLAEPEQVPGIDVTDGVLPILDAQPVLGRLVYKRKDSLGVPQARDWYGNGRTTSDERGKARSLAPQN